MSDNKSRGSIQRKVRQVNSILTREYGLKEMPGDDDPVDTLVETILSQNTSDANSGRAFAALKRKYPDWERMIDASPEKVADVIRSGGLADIKARRIIGALRRLKTEHGKITLDFLVGMTPDEAEAWLSSIDGVGPKTAAIVLLFSLGMPAFPVDTHVFRVSKRLGLVASSSSRERAQKDLSLIVPQSAYYNMHLNLIEHGRRVCISRSPRCKGCILSKLCDFNHDNHGAQA